ncbi:MAG TPA: single-stranded DNA-binding protein [Sulfurovum sp.]|nr:single-stranded DNA-binding protein [Sulfurovum sp.]
MYNKVILAGNLTRDVEVRYTQGGAAIGNTAIATSRKFKSATGEQKEEVLFVDITFFGRTAEIANQYLRKGSKVLVDGRLKLDQWTAQDGSKRSKHSVTVENLQMLGSKDDAQQGGYNAAPAGDTYSQPAPQQNNYAAPAQSTPQPAAQQAAATNIPEIDINEDEIPF